MGRAKAGRREKTMLSLYTHIEGRGLEGAGRRGKTMLLLYIISIYRRKVGQEQVRGGRRRI